MLAAGGVAASRTAQVLTPAALDETILLHAARSGMCILTEDADFGMILAMLRAAKPSVVRFDGRGMKLPQVQAKRLLHHLPQINADLERGALVTIDIVGYRIKSLPILS